MSIDPADRQLAARIIGEVETDNFYQPLLGLLSDEDLAVRRSALVAAARVRHPRLLALIIDNLDMPASRSAAMTALLAYGDLILPHVAAALADDRRAGAGRAIRLLRACGQIRGERVVDFLTEHIDQPDRDVRTALLAALSSCEYKAGSGGAPRIRALLDDEVQDAVRILIAGQEVGEKEGTEPLNRALADELNNVRQRVFYLLTYLYDRQVIMKASEGLQSSSGAQKAMALETLDVLLPGELKNLVLPLVDPGLPSEQQVQQLGHLLPVAGRDRQGRLVEIIMAEEEIWRRSWIQATAIYAAGKLGMSQLAGGIEKALSADDPSLRETATWALFTLAHERFQAHSTELLADPDPRVAQLASELAATKQ